MSSFRQKFPREESDVRCQCFAKSDLFLDWDDMSLAAKNEFARNGPIPCEGSGTPGIWCDGCRFGKVLKPEVI